MKKCICLGLAILQVLLLTACAGTFPWENETPTEPIDTIVYAYPSEVPAYTDEKELPIIAFWSPPNTEEFYQEMVDCGITDVIIDSKYGVSPGSEKMFETLAICDKVEAAAAAIVGAENVVPKGESMGAEDFAYYLEEKPGCLFNLGITEPGTEYIPLHNEKLIIDEDALEITPKVFVQYILNQMEK